MDISVIPVSYTHLFWLQLGCDGFRVDMAGSLVKNDGDGKETIKLWQDFRRFLDGEFPDAAIISEWGDPKKFLAGGFHIDVYKRQPYWKLPPAHTRAGSGNIGPLWDRIELGYIGHYTSAFLFSSLALKKWRKHSSISAYFLSISFSETALKSSKELIF